MECSYKRKWNNSLWKRKSKVKSQKKEHESTNECSPKLCKVCGKFPIPKGNRIMCNECLRHANDIYADEMELKIGGIEHE